MRKVTIVVPVLITSCQVSLNPKSGPVTPNNDDPGGQQKRGGPPGGSRRPFRKTCERRSRSRGSHGNTSRVKLTCVSSR
jgi:hypothetical protein